MTPEVPFDPQVSGASVPGVSSSSGPGGTERSRNRPRPSAAQAGAHVQGLLACCCPDRWMLGLGWHSGHPGCTPATRAALRTGCPAFQETVTRTAVPPYHQGAHGEHSPVLQ